MILKWLNASGATEVGASLADQFAPPTGAPSATPATKTARKEHAKALSEILRRIDTEVRSLRLNFYKRAKLANSFKWRLLENGVAREIAEEVTQTLILHLSMNQPGTGPSYDSAAASKDRPDSRKGQDRFVLGNEHFAHGAYAEAISCYQDSVRLNPLNADAYNNLGAALGRLGRFQEAEESFHRAIRIKPKYAEAHCNLGNVLRWRGRIAESEISLRRALKLNPSYVDARANLGLTLVLLGRLRDAKARFEKVLKVAPRHVDALLGMGDIAGMEGRFEDAEAMFRRVLAVIPKAPNAWAALAGLRKMKPSDSAWLEGAEEIAAGGIPTLHEALLRYAIGKYYNDVEDFNRAFQSYNRANQLMKEIGDDYKRDEHTLYVDELIRVYTRETVSRVAVGASASTKPVFVVGMLRSGTSLAEQIIASHPAAKGAGELPFWSDAATKHDAAVRHAVLDESTRKELAEAYLRVLAGHSDASRVVDKAPLNSDHLGVIHSVFPNARVIHMQRDPIDTCLSCYFQPFSAALNFTFDLSDLAHFYREHQRLMVHWRSVLPPGTILDVPYAELVADPEQWTRKILDFIGLPWDERCLDFHQTKRSVATASSWQVRQKIYKNSVRRWRNYEKFIGPLRGLKDLDS